jgi:hypothetical protein
MLEHLPFAFQRHDHLSGCGDFAQSTEVEWAEGADNKTVFCPFCPFHFRALRKVSTTGKMIVSLKCKGQMLQHILQAHCQNDGEIESANFFITNYLALASVNDKHTVACLVKALLETPE